MHALLPGGAGRPPTDPGIPGLKQPASYAAFSLLISSEPCTSNLPAGLAVVTISPLCFASPSSQGRQPAEQLPAFVIGPHLS